MISELKEVKEQKEVSANNAVLLLRLMVQYGTQHYGGLLKES
jgi:hypothetical protein